MAHVWAVIHHAHRVGGDVAVAANRSTDPREWTEAHYRALQNMRLCEQEAQRWGRIADEMATGLSDAWASQAA